MKGFILGFAFACAGILGAAAYSIDFNMSDKNSMNGVMEKANRALIGEVNRLLNTACDVRVGRGRLTAGDRCFRGDVMTGYDGNNIYCSSVVVECFTELTD